MGTKVADSIARALEQALEYARGNPDVVARSRLHTPEEIRARINSRERAKAAQAKPRTVRVVWRSRSRYRSARSAWSDIAAATGLTRHKVEPAHTDTRWQWRVAA